jgi:hypothetical protein
MMKQIGSPDNEPVKDIYPGHEFLYCTTQDGKLFKYIPSTPPPGKSKTEM